MPPYSMLMSVYDGEKPEFLEECLDSIYKQTLQPDEIVIVSDGPLTDDLDKVLEKYSAVFGDRLNIVRLKAPVGTAQSANEGLQVCKNEYIMKMDSDDICLPERAEKQMAFLSENPDISILGANIEEFDSDSGEVMSVRRPPEKDEEIRKFARRRSPFNNQTIVYKKSLAVKIDGYCAELVRCEDYDFMIRMLMAGAKSANIPEALVRYRTNKDNFKRRKNFTNTKYFIKVRKKIYKMGFSGFFDYIIPCFFQIIMFITPTFVTKFMYKLLRK